MEQTTAGQRTGPAWAYRVNGQADETTYRLAKDIAGNAVDMLGAEQCMATPVAAATMAVEVATEMEEVQFVNRAERLAFTDTVRRFILNRIA